MSNRSRDKEPARERVAAMRAEEARAARRRRVLLAGGAVGAVVVLLVGLVIAKAAGLGSGGDNGTTQATTGSSAAASASAAVIRAVTGVPSSVLDTVGAGDAQVVPRKIDAPALTAGGKPKVLYIGAEYCPFCAAQRWPVVVALSRFGTWTGLGQTTSATRDVYPDTATLSFHGATYRSDYLAFTGVETTGRDQVNGQYAPLDALSAADQKIFYTYNRPPYTAGSSGGIPFLDVGGRYVLSGASLSPKLLAGKSHEQIAAALADPTSPIAKAVDGSANVLTAALCELTGGKPAPVCTAAGVAAAAKVLASGQSG
ncbi:MAG: hypothetical protein QOJ90_929 [Actinomycetota bacterium]|jgi:hypothetical protein|nr:hypothetical protein [Actinomycetota bacterium]